MTWSRNMLDKVLIPMIRRTFPELITNEIVGVQPMSGPVNTIFNLNYTYNNYIDKYSQYIKLPIIKINETLFDLEIMLDENKINVDLIHLLCDIFDIVVYNVHHTMHEGEVVSFMLENPSTPETERDICMFLESINKIYDPT